MAYFQPFSKHDVMMRGTETHPSKTNYREAEKRFRLIEAAREENKNEVIESIKSGVDIDLVDQQGRSALLFAVLSNNKDVVQALIEAGADVNVSDDHGKTPLSYCAKNDNLYLREISRRSMLIDGDEERKLTVIDLDSRSEASALIEAGADINLADNQGITPLLYALQYNHRLALALIDAGADVKIIDKNGRNALHCAINGNENIVSRVTNIIGLTDNQGRTSLAAKLIEAGVDVNVVDKEGKTALIYGALDDSESKEHEFVQCMSTYHDDGKAKDSPKSVISILIKAGAELNIADNQGKTALIYAVQHGQTNFAAKLIEAGADVNVVDKEGKTALIYGALDDSESRELRRKAYCDEGLCQVINNGKENIFRMLISAGADLNKIDYLGKSALIYCAQQGKTGIRDSDFDEFGFYEMDKKSYEVVYGTLALELVKAGANLKITDSDGKTALMYSLQNKTKGLACELIEAGADVNIVDKEGRTALIYWAIDYMYIESMEYSDDEDEDDAKIDADDYKTITSMLLKAGADINITDNEGKSALVHSLQSNNHSLASTLIEAGADFHIIDKKGMTTLMHLAQSSQMTMKMDGDEDRENEDAKSLASMIIKAVTDLNVTDKDGKTALIYSLKDGNRILTCKLIDAGADVNIVDRSGKTALFYAAIYHGFERLLSKLSTDVYESCPGDQVKTSFVNCCYNEREIFTRLINAGADVDITDPEEKTVLMYVAENKYHNVLGTLNELPDPLSKYVGHIEHNYNIVASSLMKASGDINKVDNHGKTALTYFLQNNKDFAVTLINSGADVNIVDDDGKTALFYAPETCNNISMDINLADNQGVTPLIFALQNNKCLAVALIDAGADVKIIDKNGRSALHYASINGNENTVSQLTNSIDIDLTDNQGKTALIYAVQHGKRSVASKLIEAGVDVNVVDKEGKTALIYGALDDSESKEHEFVQCMSTYHDDGKAKDSPKSVISILIKAGAELNIADNQGKTALIHAVQHGQTNFAAKLIEAGADVNVVDKEGKTALIHGTLDDLESRKPTILNYRYMPTYCDDGPRGVISILIKAGANLNIADNQGKTALIHAVQGDNEDLTLKLIDAGADVKVADNDGRTAILYAILCKNERLIHNLIKAGTNASITDVQGKTALIHLAQDMTGCIGYSRKIETIDYKKVASMLIEADAKINVTDNEGKTALIYSLQNNKENLACALIEAGADVKTVDKSGRTALFYALFTGSEKVANKLKRPSYSYSTVSLTNAQKSRETVIVRLIEAGADTSITYTKGKTALIYSAEEDDKSLARALIKAGADVNVSDEEGKTALIYSVQNNNEDMVSLLIEAGADANVADHDSKTALFYGVHNEKIVLLLINNGKASINKRDRYSRSPLFYAILKSLTSAHYLLEKGSGLHRKDCYNINILSFFIGQCLRQRFDHCYMSDGLKLLQEKGIKRANIFEALINPVFCMILFTTLESQGRRKVGFLSIKTDIKEVIWVLNLAKQYVSDDDRRCETIQNTIMMMEETTDLCVAMPTILESLVELGANPSYADIDGNTALHYAACLPLAGASQDTVMKICHQLDELGASVFAKNHQKESPLLFCLSKKEWICKGNEILHVKTLVEVFTLLLEQGSSLEEITQNEKSVFHLIMELFAQGLQLHDDSVRKDVLNETLTLLHLFPSSHVTKGVTVNKRDGSLNSPLHIWAMLNFRFLARNKDSSTVDPYAFEKQILTAIFKHLIDCGAKLNDGNGKDQTPLHLCNTWTAAKLLIDAGAKTNVLDSEGSPPLLVTIKRNQNVIDESDASCIYPDVLQQPKEFWKTVVENKLDPWTVNNDGNSVMSILVKSEGFVLAQALLDVACEGNYLQTDAIAVSLLNAICKDQSTSAQWKSILVDQILKLRKNAIHLRDGEDTPLHHCCRNIIRQMEGFSLIRRLFRDVKDDFLNEITTSVDWTIVKQLLSHRFDCNVGDGSGQSCIDIAQKHPALEDLLKKQINISEVDIPVVIRWTSISKTHKSTLAKVARQQECRQVNSLWYHRNNIQKGSFGLVFVGINQKDGREVAIKRIEKLRMHRPEDKREITNLTKLADCEQVVRYLFFFDDEDFSYVVLELMEGNLYEYLGGTEFDAKKSIPLCADVVQGLKYLHDQGIIHRDLKPSNILFKTFPHLCLKIADFGLSRCIDKCSTSATVCGSVAGTRCWIAPEVLKSSFKDHSMASDVFSCGLLLHYIQAEKHPFSPADCMDKNDLPFNSAIEDNILNGNMEGWDSSLGSETTELIKHMLNSDKGKRPTAADGLTHPFFWSKKKKIAFLIGVGNQPEIECPRAKRVPPLTPVENDLEKSFGTIITKPTWNDSGYASMQPIYAEMTKKRKWPYDTYSVVALVRFIRNAYAHISEDKRPPAIRKLLLEDFVFLEYFPSLVMEVLKCVRNHGWDLRDEIKYALDDTKTSKLKGCAEGIPEEPTNLEND